MKRMIKKYSSNRFLLISAVVNMFIGAALLGMFFAFHYVTDDLSKDVSTVEILLILPALCHIIAWYIMSLLETVGLAAGIFFTISAIVCFVLVFPYMGRMREISKARRKNAKKIPKELLTEMLRTGELDKNEYDRELAKYEQEIRTSADGGRSQVAAKTILLRILAVIAAGALMIGLPVLIGYILGILH